MKTAAIVLFIAMYAVMIFKTSWRLYAAAGTAVIFLILGIMPLGGLWEAINWNVLMMITGTMIIVDFFIESRMPNRLADIILSKSPNVMWVTIFMSMFSGIVSAFIDNVATVLMIAPVGLAICRKLAMNPVPMILCIAVSSNLQGAATLVGDTTSIMLGAYADMDFIDFFWMDGKPGMFFAVELGALATIPIMMIMFRKEKQPVKADEPVEVTDYGPTAALVGVVVLLILASFIDSDKKPANTNGYICIAVAVVCMAVQWIKKKSFGTVKHALKSIDFETLGLLTSLFVVIGGITEVGLIDDMAMFIKKIGGDSLFLLYTVIVWGSVLISAFVDNIPYVATMLPVIKGAASLLGIDPAILYFGLLSGATLGGNLTPIGASANITAVGILKKNGYVVSFKEFPKIGAPFTLTAVTVGYLFIWFVWH
ncbi:MAG: SLC13 family permease [Oscillospiraceae bacterium]